LKHLEKLRGSLDRILVSIAGAIILALLGEREHAPTVNVAVCAYAAGAAARPCA
jgi:hypothetical protein